MIRLIFIIILAFSYSYSNTAEEEFNIANQEFNKKNYTNSVEIYSKLAEKYKSSELYFNLANSYYRLNEYGKSALWYERALLIEPNNSLVKNNYDILKGKLQDKIEELPGFPVISFFIELRDSLPSDGWAVLAFGFLFFASIGYLLYSMTIFQRWKFLIFIIMNSAIVFFLISFIYAYARYSYELNPNSAIIVVAISPLKVNSNITASITAELHIGTKVVILEEKENLFKVRLANGFEGWLEKKHLERI